MILSLARLLQRVHRLTHSPTQTFGWSPAWTHRHSRVIVVDVAVAAPRRSAIIRFRHPRTLVYLFTTDEEPSSEANTAGVVTNWLSSRLPEGKRKPASPPYRLSDSRLAFADGTERVLIQRRESSTGFERTAENNTEKKLGSGGIDSNGPN